MADAADQAGQIMEERAGELDRHVAKLRASMNGPSATWCVDCDELIPHARRALGGVRRCVGCQELFERRAGRG